MATSPTTLEKQNINKALKEGNYARFTDLMYLIVQGYEDDINSLKVINTYLKNQNKRYGKKYPEQKEIRQKAIGSINKVIDEYEKDKNYKITKNSFTIPVEAQDKYNKYLKKSKKEEATKVLKGKLESPVEQTKKGEVTEQTKTQFDEYADRLDEHGKKIDDYAQIKTFSKKDLEELKKTIIKFGKDRNNFLATKTLKDINPTEYNDLKLDFKGYAEQLQSLYEKNKKLLKDDEKVTKSIEQYDVTEPDIPDPEETSTEVPNKDSPKNKKNEYLFNLYKKASESRQTVADDNEFFKKAKELYPKKGIHNFNRYVNQQLGLKRNKRALSINKSGKADVLHGELKKLFTEPIRKPTPEEEQSRATLPKKITPKAVPEEELLAPKERLAKAQKELKELRATIGTAAPTEEQQENINKLEQEIKSLTPEAKKKAEEEKARSEKTTAATIRQGDYRPHFKNVTKNAVAEQISKSAEEQIRDVKNWFIFDIPDSFTGQGTSLDNPLIKQNDAREELLYSGNLYQDFIQSYTITEGIEERKNFYHENNILTSQGVKDGLTQIYYEETEEQFLQRFNKGTNGLFSQDQTPEEKNDFQNIYQTPARFHQGGYTQPQFINNNGIVHNNNLWIDNPNYFYKGAVIG